MRGVFALKLYIILLSHKYQAIRLFSCLFSLSAHQQEGTKAMQLRRILLNSNVCAVAPTARLGPSHLKLTQHLLRAQWISGRGGLRAVDSRTHHVLCAKISSAEKVQAGSQPRSRENILQPTSSSTCTLRHQPTRGEQGFDLTACKEFSHTSPVRNKARRVARGSHVTGFGDVRDASPVCEQHVLPAQ